MSAGRGIAPRQALPLLAALLLLSAPILLVRDSAMEDALITARYSRNLASGAGLSFQANERVLGTTTPGWAVLTSPIFLLAPPDWLGAKLVQSAGFACLAVGLLLFWASFPETSRTAAGWGVLLVALGVTTGECASMGMETGLVVLLGILLWREITREFLGTRWPLVGFLAALLLWVRLDSGIMVAAIVMAWLVGGRWRSLRYDIRGWTTALGVGAALFGLWVFVAIRSYGTFFPQSMLAKAAQSYETGRAGSILAMPGKAWELLGLNFPWPIVLSGLRPGLVMALALVAAVAIAMRIAPVGRFRVLLSGAILYLILYSTAFALGGAGIFPWYRHAPFILLSLGTVGTLLVAPGSRSRTVGIAALAVTLLTPRAASVASGLRRGPAGTSPFRETGEFLRARGALSVMLEPIGYVGFFSRTERVFDLGGLVSADIFKYRRTRRPGWFFEAVERVQPEYVVLREGEVEKNLGWNVGVLFPDEGSRASWLRQYSVVATFAGDGRGERLAVWQRSVASGRP